MVVVRAALTVLGFHRVRWLTGLIASRWSAGAAPAERIGWAVTGIARHVFRGASCLVQALTAEVMLRRRAYDPLLRLGVALGADRAFQSHAWVLCDAQVIVGGPGRERFTPLGACAEGLS